MGTRVLFSLVFLCAADFCAAAQKSAGSIVIIDDAFTGSAGAAEVSGSGFAVSGGLTPAAPGRRASIRDSLVDGGFFAYPFPFSRILLIAPGETPLSGPFPGKTGQAETQVRGSTFSLTVHAADWFFQPVNDVPGHSVRLSTIDAPGASLPAAQTLVQGTAVFQGFSVASTTGTFSLHADDLTTPSFGVSASTLTIALPATSSPTARLHLTQDAIYATLGGAITGTASDPTGVQRVQLAVRRVDTALYYDQPAHAFSLASQAFFDGVLGQRGAPFTTWYFSVPDSDLVDGARYEVQLVAENPSRLRVPAVSTFTFDSRGLAFSPDDGKGAAVAYSTSPIPGCVALTTTVTVTLGGAGIRAGGAVALRVPAGWTVPERVVWASPAVPGEVAVLSTSAAFGVAGATQVTLSPSSFGGVPLGNGWILLRVASGAAAAMNPGEEVSFALRARPPIGPQGRGRQRFDVRTQAYSTGTLVAIAAQPSVDLTTGSLVSLAFREGAAISLGPLQFSPTVQIETVDLCGNPAPPPAALTVTPQAGTIDPSGNYAVDGSAAFFAEQSGAAISELTIFPPETRPFAPGGFYYRTSMAGPRSQFLRLTGSIIVAESYRFIDLRASSVSLSAVSIDTGTLSPGATSAVLAGGAPAVIRFTAADPQVPWEVLVATTVGFESPFFRATGWGDAGAPQAVFWPGTDARTAPPRAVGPGRYGVLIRAGGGSAENRSLEARVPASAFIFGELGASGAGALVRAQGPGAAPGSFSVASSSGYFELYGLQDGRRYLVTASTRTTALGQPVELSTAAPNVAAAAAGGDAGPLAFSAPSVFRVGVSLPSPASTELVGRVGARTADYSRRSDGALHFAAGAARSDNGGHAFGVAAGTWTVLALGPGTYELDVDVPQVGISTVVPARTLVAGQVQDLELFFARKASVYGYAVLPATRAFGSWISVHARKDGDSVPSRYGGGFAAGDPAPRSSAPFALFGLDAGTWTVTARSLGFVSTSAVVVVSTTDVGDPTSFQGGPVLTLGLGGVLQATVTVLGDTRALPGACSSPAPGACPSSGFVLFAQAYNLGDFSSVSVPVRLSTSATATAAAFTISGLSSGRHLVRAFAPGFKPEPPGGTIVAIATPSVATAWVALRANDARLRLDVRLPQPAGGACYSTGTFRGLGFLLDRRPEAAPVAGGDITALAPTVTGLASRADPATGSELSFHCSSMSFLSPALGTGARRVWAVSGSSGQASLQTLPLVQGATTVFAAELGGAVYTVTGTVRLSGTLTFSRPDGSAVTVSSTTGLAALAPSAEYCLLSSSAPVSLSSARVELVPIPDGGELPGPPLKAAEAGGDCRRFSLPGAALSNGLPDPSFKFPALVAYSGAIRKDGSFSISSVPAGSYLLRNVADLDLDPANGQEAAEFRAVVRISSGGSLGEVRLSPGVAVSGAVLAPPGFSGSRPIRALLSDPEARVVAAAEVALGGGSAAFSFPRVGPGRYLLQAEDLGFPRAYAAAPRTIEVGVGEATGQDLRLVLGGVIRARVAVESSKPDGGFESTLVSASNPELLPAGLQVNAVAVPWFQGGFFTAVGRNCGSSEGGGARCRDAALDSAGQLVLSNVLPGTYDVEFAAPAAAEAVGVGGASLVGRLVSGVRVAEGQSVDLGTVRLSAAATLTGRVTDATSGAGVANVPLRALPSLSSPGDRSRRRGPPQALSSSDGRYALSGLDPAVRYYDVVAAAREAAPFGRSLPPYEQRVVSNVDLRSTATLDFSLIPASFTISGRVAAPAGEALFTAVDGLELPGALVTLQKSGVVPVLDPAADIKAFTDLDGRFAVQALTTGTYRLTVAAAGLAKVERTVDARAASVDVGALTLTLGGTLSGRLLLADGSAPGEDDVEAVAAVTPDLAEFLPGTLERDQALRAVTGYRVSGFAPGRRYRLLLATARGEGVAPPEASSIVFTSSAEARALDVVFRPEPPRVQATARRRGDAFRIDFLLSQALRSRAGADDDLQALVATVAARGTLSERELSQDRGRLSVTYTPGLVSPGVRESSFTLRFSGRSALRDPASAASADPEFAVVSTITFHVGVDGHRRAAVNNFQGGRVAVEGDSGRVSLPKGAFAVDASSTVEVTFRRSDKPLAVSRGLGTAAATLASLRYPAAAYPPSLVTALAAAPPDAAASGPFYDVGLPAGMAAQLARPAELCVAYEAGKDPSALNLYWYNEAANAYVLQQDSLGAEPNVDRGSRTKCQNVNHFSTFVLLESGLPVISGNAFAGGSMEAIAFPNPFDLSVKQVTPIHGLAAQSVRGTMLRLAVPASVGGAARIDIFNVAGERVRTLDLGSIPGGAYYYQTWDGRNDAGRDVASGVYLAQVKVGGRSAFFKMAVLK